MLALTPHTLNRGWVSGHHVVRVIPPGATKRDTRRLGPVDYGDGVASARQAAVTNALAIASPTPAAGM